MKLGYGGTKTEMERLLADAEKLSGQKYSIDSLMDVYNAIHVVQEEMGITGTTAKEAAGTIEGSVGSMKAAWENLLTAFGSTDMPIDTFTKNFVDSLSGAASNVVPRIGQIVQSIGMAFPDLVGNLFENLKSTIEENDLGNTLLDGVDTLVTNAAQVLESMIGSIFDGDNLTNLIERAAGTAGMIGESVWNILKLGMEVIPEKLPEIIDILNGMITGVVDTLTEDLPAITESIASTIEKLVGGISELLRSDSGANLIPAVIQSIVDIALAIGENIQPVLSAVMNSIPKIVDAIVSNLGDVINAGTQIIEMLIDGITSDDGSLLDSAIAVVMKFVDSIIENLDDVLIAAERLIMALLDGLTKPETLGKIISAGTTMLVKLIEGLASATGSLLGFTDQLANDIGTWIVDYDWAAFGLSIIEGIADGLLKLDGVQEAVDAFAEIWAIGYLDLEETAGLIKDAFLGMWDILVQAGASAYDSVHEFIDNVASLWQSGWDTLEEFGGKVYDAIESFKTSWPEFWDNINTTLTEKIDSFKERLQAIPEKFIELVSKAKQWGTDLISNFVSGLKENPIINGASKIAQTVRDYIGFSEPKLGPLSNFHTYAPDMIDLFAQGIRDNAYKIGNEFNNALDLDTDLGTATVGIEANSAYNSSNNAQNAPHGAPMYGGANDSSELFGLLNAILAAIREGKQIVLDTETVNSSLGRVQTNDERSVLV